MADLTDLEAAGSTKIVGSDAAGLETNAVGADSNGNLKTINPSDGPVTPGSAAASSALAGGQFNTTPPTLTNAQQSAVQVDSHGNLKTVNIGQIVRKYFDYIAPTYPLTTQEVYTFKVGGAGGTTVAIVTVNYTDASKEVLGPISVVEF